MPLQNKQQEFYRFYQKLIALYNDWAKAIMYLYFTKQYDRCKELIKIVNKIDDAFYDRENTE